MRNSLKVFAFAVLAFGLLQTSYAGDRYSTGGRTVPVQPGDKPGEVKFDDATAAQRKASQAAGTIGNTGAQAPTGRNGAPAVPFTGTVPLKTQTPTTSGAPTATVPRATGQRIGRTAPAATAPTKGAVAMLDDAAAKARANGMDDIARDIDVYRKTIADQISRGGVEDGKVVVAQRLSDMVDSMIKARQEQRCDDTCTLIAKEAIARSVARNDAERQGELEQTSRYFGSLDKEGMIGLGRLVSTWKGEYDAAIKAGKSDAEARLEAGRKTDEFLKKELGEDYAAFCKASKAAKAAGKPTVAAPTHRTEATNGSVTRASAEERPCPPEYMGVCAL